MGTGPLILYAALSGAFAGLLAAAFAWALKSLNFLFGNLLGYLPPNPPGEGGLTQTFAAPPSPFLLLLPLGYALASLWGAGQGVAAFPGWGLTFLEHIRQVLGSLIQLSLYSPLGREGPMALLGHRIGHSLGRRFPKAGGEGLAFAGLAAGLAAALHAPVTGALLATETLYRGLRLEVGALAPALIGALSGFAIYGAFFGYAPLLDLKEGDFSPSAFLSGLLLGFLAAGLGNLWLLLARVLQSPLKRVPLPLRHALFGLALMGSFLWIPEALGDGLGWVQVSLTPLLSARALFLLLLAHLFLLVLAAAVRAYGGYITPALALGGLLGALLSKLLPPLFPHPDATALAAMAAFLAGVARAPFAALLFAGEWGGYTVTPLAIPAVFLSYALASIQLLDLGEERDRPQTIPSETPPRTEPPPSAPEDEAKPEAPRG
ncbi:MAG: chloride channel protein [Thermaceae bacterium]